MNVKQNILFLCTGNSCRSQMAEGLCRHYKSECFNVYSAGIKKHGLNPNAVKVMAELDIDISSHFSKTHEDLKTIDFDIVITVCGHADETCPTFHGKPRVIHVGFDDPPKLAANAQNEDEALHHYRRVRDEISAFVDTLPASIQD